MNDSYSELLVKKEQTGKDKVIKFLLIGVIAATAVVGVIIPLVWVLTLGLGIAAYFILPNLDLEYDSCSRSERSTLLIKNFIQYANIRNRFGKREI